METGINGSPGPVPISEAGFEMELVISLRNAIQRELRPIMERKSQNDDRSFRLKKLYTRSVNFSIIPIGSLPANSENLRWQSELETEQRLFI
jgi:hypothetical protein